MVVTWGKLDSSSGCEVQEGVTWEQCLQNCWKNESCVMVSLDSSGTCQSCTFQSDIPGVTQKTKEDNVKVGFKIKVDDNVEECPAGENGPTFDGAQAEGDASTTTDNGMIQNYTITYTGSGWEFQTFSMKRCVGGFAFYRRATLDWCIAVSYTPNANTSYSRRFALCDQHSTAKTTVTPSGVASADEVEGVVFQLFRLKERETSLTSFYAFAGAKRTDECVLTPKTDTCMSIDGFVTEDKTVTNFDAFQFMTDASVGAEEGRQCMVMIWDTVNDGKVDFVECEGPYPYPIWGVICGHEALS